MLELKFRSSAFVWYPGHYSSLAIWDSYWAVKMSNVICSFSLDILRDRFQHHFELLWERFQSYQKVENLNYIVHISCASIDLILMYLRSNEISERNTLSLLVYLQKVNYFVQSWKESMKYFITFYLNYYEQCMYFLSSFFPDPLLK